MKGNILSIVYDDSYINSSNHRTIKSAFFNIINFLKYHGFSVHDSDSFLSSNKRKSDIDIFILIIFFRPYQIPGNKVSILR